MFALGILNGKLPHVMMLRIGVQRVRTEIVKLQPESASSESRPLRLPKLVHFLALVTNCDQGRRDK